MPDRAAERLSPWQHGHRGESPAPAPTPLPAGVADTVVVGAGLVGLTTALLLARAGQAVTVVEARWVGAGTTGASTAKVSLLQGTRLTQIARRQDTHAVQAYVDANVEGQAWLRRFCDDHDVAIDPRDAYTFAWTEHGSRQARSEMSLAERAGLDVAWVPELHLPFETRGAVRLPGQFQLDPVSLLLALRHEAERHGVRVVEGARVHTVTGHEPVRVDTDRGALQGRRAVIATGMPILDRGGFFGRMVPARSHTIALRTEQAVIDGMLLSADEPSRSLRDAEDGRLLLVGGAGHTTGRGGSTAARISELRTWAQHHFPDAVETHAWSAQDYLPTRGLPFAGPVLPGASHVLVAGGFAKWGLTNGVAAALALAGRILGGHHAWARVFDPWRNRAALLPAAGANAEVAFEVARGWIRPVAPGGGLPSAGDGGEIRYDRLGAPTARSRVDGVVREVSALCPHLGGVVTWNDGEASWDCPLHGSRFAPDGTVLEGPATCGLAAR